MRFGPANVIIDDDLPRPEAAAGQMLVRVQASAVGNWDALGGLFKTDASGNASCTPVFGAIAQHGERLCAGRPGGLTHMNLVSVEANPGE